ncbi:MAG TPA: hypothetical protein VIL01_04275 [Thermomicrobiales bacterium]
MLVVSAKGRRSALGLFAVLVYLIFGQIFAPGFTHYWGFHLAQTLAILATVLALETLLLPEGGLSWPTHLLTVVVTAADTLGTAGDLYHSFDLYDKIIHFSSGATVAAISYDILTAMHRRQRLSLGSGVRLALAVAASFILAGLGWEAYEHYGDVIFSTDRVQSRVDTIHDLISNVCGSILAASVLWVREAAVRAPATDLSRVSMDRVREQRKG